MDCFKLVSRIKEVFNEYFGPRFEPDLELKVSFGQGRQPDFVLHLSCINYQPSNESTGNYLRVDSVEVNSSSPYSSDMLYIAFHNGLTVVKKEN